MESPNPSFKNYLPASIALMLIGWGGLAGLLFFSLPLVWSRWGFFVFMIMAFSGTALPVVYFLHQRFPSDSEVEANIIVRQSIWIGVYFSMLAWLQLGRIVTLYVVIGLAAGMIAIEYFIRLREKANWKKPSIPDDLPA